MVDQITDITHKVQSYSSCSRLRGSYFKLLRMGTEVEFQVSILVAQCHVKSFYMCSCAFTVAFTSLSTTTTSPSPEKQRLNGTVWVKSIIYNYQSSSHLSETGPYSVGQANFELVAILLLQPLDC